MAESRGKAELIIGKNRHGKTDTIRTKFNGEYSLFSDDDDFASRGGADDSFASSHDSANTRSYTPPPATPAGPNVDDVPDDF